MTQTRFELRHRRVAVHKRDQVQWSTGEGTVGGLVYIELETWLRERDSEVVNEIRAADERLESFLEWYGDEHHKYGRRVSPGVAALYWHWYHAAAPPALTRERFERLRDHLAKSWRSEWLDSEYHPGSSLVMEFFWLHQGDWILQEHLVAAVREFDEYEAASKLPDWRRRKRRRTAAARRKTIKQLYEQALLTAVPPADSLLSPPPVAQHSRRRSHGAP
jgi:hypothetical protein